MRRLRFGLWFGAFVAITFKDESQSQYDKSENCLEAVRRGKNGVVDSAKPIEHVSPHHVELGLAEDDREKGVFEEWGHLFRIIDAIEDKPQHS